MVEAWDVVNKPTYTYSGGGDIWANDWPAYWYMGGYYYCTIGHRITTHETLTITQLGAARYYYPYYYYNIRLWNADTSTLLRQVSYPYIPYYSWRWFNIAPITIPAGNYMLSVGVRGYYQCGHDNPGTTADGMVTSEAWHRAYGQYSYPSSEMGTNPIPYIDMKYTYSIQVPLTIRDYFDIWVDNDAPVVLSTSVSPTAGFEGTDVYFTGSFTDEGMDDDWRYKWLFGDGTESAWYNVVKFSGGARVLLYHSVAGYETELMDTWTTLFGHYAVQFDEWNFIGTSFGGQGLMDNDDLFQYDVLIVPINTAPTVGWDDDLGDQLADYVDQGGGVVEMVACFYDGAPWGIPGRWRDEGYGCFDYGGIGMSSTTTSLDPACPYFSGIPAGTISSWGTSIPISTYGYPGDATWAADYAFYPASTYKPEGTMGPGSGRIAGLNIFIPQGYRSGEAMEVTANAAWWASQAIPPTPLAMPITTDPVGHTYVDDHPDHVTTEDIFTATLVVEDDDHGKVVKLGGETQLSFEDFSPGYPFPPSGWSRNSGAWWYSYSSNAGGSSPEAICRWYACTGDDTLTSAPVNTLGQPALTARFKQYMNHYTSSFEIQLRARSDPTDPWTVHYSRTVTGDFGPETLEVDITPDIGPATQVQLRFFGYYWNLDYWYVDDVELFSFQAYIMSGQGMGSTEVTIQNALPGVVAPAGFVDTVNEKVTIAFEGFELTDAAIQERTEEFWYKVRFGDGATWPADGSWFYKGTIAPPDFKVLVLHSLGTFEDAVPGIQAELTAMGFGPYLTLDEWNFGPIGTNSNPSLAYMLDYDVILVTINYYIFSSARLDDLGDKLADYSDAGGGVIQMTFSAGSSYYSQISGRWMDDGYNPIRYAPNHYGYLSMGDVHHECDINEDVNSGQCYYKHGTSGLTAGADECIDYTNGYRLAAHTPENHHAPGGGRVVGLNYFPWWPYADGDMRKLCAQSLVWAWGEEIPTEVLTTMVHDYGDNGVYDFEVEVLDDDMDWTWNFLDMGGPAPGDQPVPGPDATTTVSTFPVTVLNVDPHITPIQAKVAFDMVIRTTGEPNNPATMTLMKNGIPQKSVTCHHDGNYKMESMPVVLDMGTINEYSVEIHYVNDDSGANPTWVYEGRFASGHTKELKHVFNDGSAVWVIDADAIKTMIVGEDIIFTADGHDDGSDDLAFFWQYGDGECDINIYANALHPGPSGPVAGVPTLASEICHAHPDSEAQYVPGINSIRTPEMNPIDIDDMTTHAFMEPGYYYVTLTLLDDDARDGYPSYQYFLTGGGCDMEYYEVDLA
jgi:hypothetical protein